jgi:hypothetical protein
VSIEAMPSDGMIRRVTDQDGHPAGVPPVVQTIPAPGCQRLQTVYGYGLGLYLQPASDMDSSLAFEVPGRRERFYFLLRTI